MMKSKRLLLTLLMALLVPWAAMAQECEISYTLTDSYGDGWNGGALVVTDVTTSTQLANLTISSGSSLTGSIPVINEHEISFAYTTGSYAYENSWVIYDANGNTIWEGEGSDGNQTYSYTAVCPSCIMPQALAVTLTPGNGTIATLNWTAGGTETNWVLEYGTASDFTGATSVNVSGTPTQDLTGLTAETTYYARVKADCGGGDESEWTAISFIPTNAYSITVNEGAATNVYVPIYGFYVDNYSYSQFIIPAGDLNDMIYGTISQMVFYGNNTGSNPHWDNAMFEVYVLETRESTLDALTDWTTMTKVMDAAHLEIENGQMVVTLDNPFQYLGSNLMIGIKQTVSGSYSSCTWQGVAATGASMGGYGTSVSQQNFLPKTTFQYMPGEEPSCFIPTSLNVSNVTNRTAELSWTENGEATEWEISYTLQDREFTATATTNPFTLTGLEPESEYIVKVRANCGEGEYSDWSGTQTFTTLVACEVPTDLTVTDLGPFSATLNWASEVGNFNVRYRIATSYETIWEDDFENGLGQWTVLHGDDATAPSAGYWYIIDPQAGLELDAHSGTHVVSSWSWNGSEYNADNYLVSPQVDLQGVVKFYVRTNAGYPDKYEVLLSTTGSAIDDFTVTLQAMATAPANGEWNEVVIPLTGYTGQGYIAIHHQDYDANYLLIDDFGIYEQIAAGSWTETTVADTTLAITGLTDETGYEWQVQAVCGGEDGASAWSSMATFNTPSNCEVPANLTAEDIDAYSATLNWTGIQDSYNVRYRTAEAWETFYFNNFNTDREGWTWTENPTTIYGFADPIYGIIGDNNYFLPMGWNTTEEATIISPELPEYPSGSKVEFYHFGYQVANTFQVGYSSTTSDLDAFTWGNPIEAGDGYTLYSETLADGIKYVAFKATASVQAACVFIDNFGIYGNQVPAGSWTDATVNATTLAISGLTGSTDYEWQVQGINAGCEGGVTEWSAMATFTTEPSCLVPTELGVDEVTATTAVISWTSDATLFDIEVNEEVIEGVANPYTLEGLDPETIYEVRVRANCGNGDYSDWTDYIDFVTSCGGAKDLPYEFGFDLADMGEYYACWLAASYNSANESRMGLYYDPADETNIVFRFSSYSSSEDYRQILVSPELNTEAAVAVQFDYKTSNTSAETFQVGYATDDFTSLDDFTFGDAISVNNNTEWATYSETFPAGTKYVAVLYSSNYQYYMYVDNFKFEESLGVTQTLELTAGYNWVSLYIDSDPMELLEALQEGLGENGVSIEGPEGLNENLGEGTWWGDLDYVGLTSGTMYLVLVEDDCEVSLEGMPVDPATVEITINPGYNWIGFTGTEEVSVEAALADFDAEDGDAIEGTEGMTEYLGEGMWWGDFETFVPGQGYMYNSASDEVKTLYFNLGGEKARSSVVVSGSLTKQPVKAEVKSEAAKAVYGNMAKTKDSVKKTNK